MKKISLLLLLGCLLAHGNLYAQFGDWFKSKKEELSQKAKDKADQRINNTADNILSKTDSLKIGSGKNKKKKIQEQNPEVENSNHNDASNTTTATNNTSQTQAESITTATTNDNQCTIQTNIKSIAGKEKTENKLKEIDGVYSINIDIRTGKLLIEYDKEEATYKNILKVINKAGFKTENQ